MSCSANRFWKFARFAPEQPRLRPEEYVRLIARIAHQPFYKLPYTAQQRIVVPGYANVFEFSKDYETAFKKNIGSKTISCLSYRNWRMSVGVTRAHQAATARQICDQLDHGLCDQAHITDWPELNHSVLFYSYRQVNDGIEFAAYDPNEEKKPRQLVFDAKTSSFLLDRTPYFNGGRVNVTKTYVSLWK